MLLLAARLSSELKDTEDSCKHRRESNHSSFDRLGRRVGRPTPEAAGTLCTEQVRNPSTPNPSSSSIHSPIDPKPRQKQSPFDKTAQLLRLKRRSGNPRHTTPRREPRNPKLSCSPLSPHMPSGPKPPRGVAACMKRTALKPLHS